MKDADLQEEEEIRCSLIEQIEQVKETECILNNITAQELDELINFSIKNGVNKHDKLEDVVRLKKETDKFNENEKELDVTFVDEIEYSPFKPILNQTELNRLMYAMDGPNSAIDVVNDPCCPKCDRIIKSAPPNTDLCEDCEVIEDFVKRCSDIKFCHNCNLFKEGKCEITYEYRLPYNFDYFVEIGSKLKLVKWLKKFPLPSKVLTREQQIESAMKNPAIKAASEWKFGEALNGDGPFKCNNSTSVDDEVLQNEETVLLGDLIKTIINLTHKQRICIQNTLNKLNW